MGDNFIEIKSVKGIKGPIVSKIEQFTDTIHWNLRFNIQLNPETVHEDNMDVTDVEGYILTSIINYNADKNAIIISPKEPYKPNSTYILNVSNRVRSKGNNSLKEEVQIIFQLKGAEISSFKVLKGKERLDIDIKPSKYAPTPAQLKRDRLPLISQHYNFWTPVGALIISVVAYLTRHILLIEIGIALLLIGIIHIIYQFTNKKAASIRFYNKGAVFYNKAEYGDASEQFDLALLKNPDNSFALKGIKRLSSSQYVKAYDK